jgi:hypothetical protein
VLIYYSYKCCFVALIEAWHTVSKAYCLLCFCDFPRSRQIKNSIFFHSVLALSQRCHGTFAVICDTNTRELLDQSCTWQFLKFEHEGTHSVCAHLSDASPKSASLAPDPPQEISTPTLSLNCRLTSLSRRTHVYLSEASIEAFSPQALYNGQKFTTVEAMAFFQKISSADC